MSEIKIPEDNVPPPLPGPENRIRPISNDMPVKHADEMFCSNCGAIIKIRSLSCPRCGKKLRKEGLGCLPVAAIAIGIGVFGFAIIGILAAIAIPQFTAYRTRAYQASVKAELNEICKAEVSYFKQNDKYTDSLEELGYIAKPNISIQITEFDDKCFYAQGEMKNLNKRYLINCDCEITEVGIESAGK
jgi:type IV pilus assembly protein PilA